MVVHQFNELKIFNESDDDDATGPIIFDLQHDEHLRLGVQPRALEDSIQFDLAGEDHDFEAIISYRKSWNEPDEVTDGSTDWVIDWKLRSEGRRVGKEGVSTCGSGGWTSQ